MIKIYKIENFTKELVASLPNTLQSLQKYDKMNLTIIGRPNINDWLGHLTTQLVITDMEIEDARFSF